MSEAHFKQSALTVDYVAVAAAVIALVFAEAHRQSAVAAEWKYSARRGEWGIILGVEYPRDMPGQRQRDLGD